MNLFSYFQNLYFSRIENKTTTEDPQTDRLIAAMAKLQLTMNKTEQLLKSSTNKENKSV